MDSAMSKIEQRICSSPKGKIFFPNDFIEIASDEAIRQALTRLCKDGKITRITHGIYCRPKIDNKFGFGVFLPGVEEVALALAKRDMAKVAPAGVYAENILGLSTQVPMNYVFLTNGSARSVKIYNGREIKFKHTIPKNLAFKSRLAMLITFALKSIGKENIKKEHIDRITELLKNEPKKSVMADVGLMPVWIRKIVTDAYE